MFLLITSFIAGILTILAPCILPLLPVIVGGSLSDGKVNKKKALTIVTSLGVSVILFTLILKVSTLFISIPEYTWKLISGSIVMFLGIVTLFPAIWETSFMARMSAKSNIALGKGDQKKNFWGDVIVGGALGPVFSTCSPTYFIVLATVLPVSPALGMLYILAYTVGLCLALLTVAAIGQKIMAKLNIAADPKGVFKRVLGVIFLLVGLAIITGFDKKLQTIILESGFFDITKVEQRLLEKNTNNTKSDSNTSSENFSEENVPTTNQSKSAYLTKEQKSKKFKTIPELSTIDGYVNTDGKPITLESLRGKVVLVDIWTYSCINCQRTIPYLNDWYAKYKDSGLEIVGLHTPEFGFEKVQSNVEKAVEKFKIKYPVVLDNDYSTWLELGNQFWPRKYLVDIDGFIVYDHIGEGAYDITEKAIQKSLQERSDRLGMENNISTTISTPTGTTSFDPSKVNSPEVYFGSGRNNLLANGKAYSTGEQSLTLPKSTPVKNKLYLDGVWDFSQEYTENKTPANIIFSYESKNVYMVASSQNGVDVEVYKDDILVKTINIKEEKLYHLIEGEGYGTHVLKIKVPSAGLQAFTFTFG